MLSAYFSISDVDGSELGTHFYLCSQNTAFRVGCCQYKHEHLADYQGVGALTKSRNLPSFCGSSVSLFGFQ